MESCPCKGLQVYTFNSVLLHDPGGWKDWCPFFYPVQSNEALNEHIKFDFRSLKFGLKWSLVWTGHLIEKSDQSNGVDLLEKSHSMDVLLTFHDIIWSQRLQVQSLLQAKFCIEIFFQAVKLDIDSQSTLKQYFFSVIWIWKLFQDHCKNFFKRWKMK